MGIHFRKAPLGEVIVEAHWQVPMLSAGPVGIPLGSHEKFFEAVADAAAEAGYLRAERLIPPGFPPSLGQVSQRYRPLPECTNEHQRSTLWQCGPGLFTVNAVQPYRSWDDFRVWIEKGLEAIGTARGKDSTPFTQLVVRYVNAFDSDAIEDRASSTFLRDVFGLNVTFPEVMSNVVHGGDEVMVKVETEHRLSMGMNLSVTVGPGQLQNEPVMLMITAMVKSTPTPPREAMKALDNAHVVLHDLFVRMTTPLHEKMGLVATES